MENMMLWQCPKCSWHEFVLVTIATKPYTVVVLCAGCGKEVRRLYEQDL